MRHASCCRMHFSCVKPRAQLTTNYVPVHSRYCGSRATYIRMNTSVTFLLHSRFLASIRENSAREELKWRRLWIMQALLDTFHKLFSGLRDWNRSGWRCSLSLPSMSHHVQQTEAQGRVCKFPTNFSHRHEIVRSEVVEHNIMQFGDDISGTSGEFHQQLPKFLLCYHANPNQRAFLALTVRYHGFGDCAVHGNVKKTRLLLERHAHVKVP
mmetsp:Transcript_8700/g.17061  ORF Transcript_8700/g.17061 Transcript_8700/m.17061 type:complete len:211 (-) Transcript_8700:320-952(-)